MISFFFNDTAPPVIYTLSLHDALPISRGDEVRAARIEPEGEDRRVLEKPDLVRGRRIALAGETLHRAPGRLVLAKPGAADHGRGRRRSGRSRTGHVRRKCTDGGGHVDERRWLWPALLRGR